MAASTTKNRAKTTARPVRHRAGVELIQQVLSPDTTPVLGLYIHTAAGCLARSIAAVREFDRVEPYLLGTPAILAVRPGISQTELSQYLGGGRAKAGLQVAKCIRLGWVKRVVSGDDRRKYTLHLTPRGREMLQQIGPVIKRHESRFASSLTAQEKILLQSLLAKLIAF